MTLKRKTTVLIAALSLAWATPGIAQEADDTPRSADEEGFVLEQFPDRLPQTTNQCIFFRSLHDFRPLNRYNLVVWAPSRKHPYHIQLDRPCHGLRFAHTIGFKSNNDGRLCGFGGDAVLVDQGGGIPQRCTIGSITKLNEEQLQALLAQGRGRSLQEKREDKKLELREASD